MANRDDGLPRNLLLLAGGLVAGLVVGRIAAPLVARAVGLARSSAPRGDAFDDLIADHERVLAALDRAAGAASTGERTALFLTIKRDLARHALAEEDVIYPLIAEDASAADEVKRLYEEHGAVKTLLAEIEACLEAADVAGYRTRVRALRDAVREHARAEESRWFPQLRERLDQRHRALLAGKVEREKALLA